MQRLEARRVEGSDAVATEYVDDFAEGGPEERRWEYERAGADGYVERLYRRSGDGWELLTEWVFERR